MRVLTGSDVLKKNFDSSVVTIGNFDGVHRGHAELFRQVKAAAAQRGLPAVVVTFEPHPLTVLAPKNAPPLITTFAQKKALIAETGVDCLAAIDFTPEFSRMPAEAFVRDILMGCLGMRHIIIGHDYAFGKDRQGNQKTLERLGKEYGFTLEDISPVGEGRTIFSSSLARRLISRGDMPEATGILGRYHVISGTVVHGREIGQTLGFPTANISTSNELLPPDGVYAVMVAVDGRILQGACNIGNNPTFEGGARTIEAFLLDFSGQLYGHEIAICFVQRLREVMKFPDVAALITAIQQDVATTKSILAAADQSLIKPLFSPERIGE
ncbi:bifunctional riboflavin kinase/FAD synthetase [Oryzomonas japonica]|uniref:Riboflavin biosynthesis protein n=1 Tax=Oryzomonas japonica TaxID=2603858 RepID=A0A7J4ZTR5_9BACT|nr:bifunctional riboflavin kinase/FAD synthetase [Oryzomonas japonica]KAB0666831.1 bifunctional riboflavin kinase/FAD synthetase [Oryzomonas japonica]